MDQAKNVPIVAKIIAVLYYIGGVYLILTGILSLVLGGMIGFGIPILSALGFVGGIIVIALGILLFYGGRGLYQGKSWARFLAIIVASLVIISSIVVMISGDISGNILSLIINLAIGSYFLFNIKIKEIFS